MTVERPIQFAATLITTCILPSLSLNIEGITRGIGNIGDGSSHTSGSTNTGNTEVLTFGRCINGGFEWLVFTMIHFPSFKAGTSGSIPHLEACEVSMFYLSCIHEFERIWYTIILNFLPPFLFLQRTAPHTLVLYPSLECTFIGSPLLRQHTAHVFPSTSKKSCLFFMCDSRWLLPASVFACFTVRYSLPPAVATMDPS